MHRLRKPRFWAHIGCLGCLFAALISVGSSSTTVAEELRGSNPWANTLSWEEKQSRGPFVCHAEFSLAPYQGLLEELVGLQAELVRCLGIRPADKGSIELYLFRDRDSYSRFLQKYLSNIPPRRALFCKIGNGPGCVFAYQGKNFETDVRHECTHALMHAVLNDVPLWLDEGLAEYFEVPSSQRAFDNPHQKTLRWKLRFGIAPDLAKVENKADMGQMTTADYCCAWAWMHYLLHGSREGHGELVEFLRDLDQGKQVNRFSRRLYDRQPNAQRHLVAHFKGWKR